MCTFRENTLDLGVFHHGILETQKFLKRVWYKFSYGMSALVVVSQIQVTSLWVKDNLTQFVFAASRLDAARVTKETIFRQIWIFGFHEFTKKKRHLFFKQSRQGTGEPKLFQHLDPMSFLCPIHSCQGHTDVLTGFYPIFHLTYCFL